MHVEHASFWWPAPADEPPAAACIRPRRAARRPRPHAAAAAAPVLADVCLRDVRRGEFDGHGRGRRRQVGAAARAARRARPRRRCRVAGPLSYAPQSARIAAASVRENVLSARRSSARGTRRRSRSCALADDLSRLARRRPHRDRRALSLSRAARRRGSGGARATYARAAVALLDDPLAAVDPAVARHSRALRVRGALRASRAAVFLVTHDEHALHRAHRSCNLPGDGRCVLVEPPPPPPPPRALPASNGTSVSASNSCAAASARVFVTRRPSR